MQKNHKIKQKFGIMSFIALLLVFLALAGTGALLYLNGRYIFIPEGALFIYYSITAFAYMCVSILIIVLLIARSGSYISRSIVRMKDFVGKMASGESGPPEYYSYNELNELADALRRLAAIRSAELEELRRASGPVNLAPVWPSAPDEEVLARPLRPFERNPDSVLDMEEIVEDPIEGAPDMNEPSIDIIKDNSDEKAAAPVRTQDVLYMTSSNGIEAKDGSDKAEWHYMRNENAVDYDDFISRIKGPAARVSVGASDALTSVMSLSSAASGQAEKIQDYSKALKAATELSSQNASISSETLAAIKENVRIASHNIDDARRLTDAMKSIVHSSQQISRILKVIDDVAFKTNILALNASVEAARAGQGGKGFGVIADEIRNLSMKSTDAAKETSELIKISMDSADEIEELVKLTSKNVNMMEQNSLVCSEGVERLSLSSKYQSDSIKDIGAGFEQISAMVNENFALAEKSAAAAQNITKQAEELCGVIELLDRKNAD